MGDQTQQPGPDGGAEPIEDRDVESHELRETAGVPDEAGAEQAKRGKVIPTSEDVDDVEGHRMSRHSDARLKQHIRLI